MAGEGPAVVLIHGMAGSSRTWREVMPLLARSYTVIAPDLPGHGESAKPLGDYSLGAYASGLRDLIVGALGIEKATLVGQSLGGGVAMQLAYQHPELCERLVVVGSGALGREVSWILRLLTLPGAEYLFPALFPRFLRDPGDWLGAFFQARGILAPHVSEMWRAYISLTETKNRRAFCARCASDPGGQTVSALDRLYLAAALPALIVWGEARQHHPGGARPRGARRLPGSRLEIFEGAGHFVHVEQPLKFAAVLANFIASTVPARSDTESYRELVLAHAN
jgi:pimeloyl-ACP methyl ester carboxylesterase